MSKRFNSTKVLEALINGNLEQAKELTLEGLTDENFEQLSRNLEYQTSLLSVGSDDLDTAFNTLARRVCSVVIRILSYTKMSSSAKYELAITYRELFTP